MKKLRTFLAIIFALLVVSLLFSWYNTAHAPTQPTNQAPAIACEALQIINPQQNEKVSQTFTVEVIVDNRIPECNWTVFEANAGRIEVTDKTDTIVGNGSLTTQEEWMTENPVTYTSEITLMPTTAQGQLIVTITEENQNDEPPQTVSFPLSY